MTGYRRRFVIYNMCLIGFVLLAAFIALGISQHNAQMAELEKTMQLVTEPWDPGDGHFRPVGGRDDGGLHIEPPDGEKPEGTPPPDGPHGEKPGDKPDEKYDRRISSEGIMTVYYASATKEISVLSNGYGTEESDLADIVGEIVEAKKDFGSLSSGVIYRREATADGFKIAIADRAYITSRTLRNAVLLGAVFVAAMGLLLPISIWLSKLAAKPMERAVQLERQFFQDISHDLKTPVTVVLANNSILRSNPEATVEEQRQWLDSTDDAAKNMMNLVNEMLTLASLEAVAESGRGAAKKAELRPVNLSQAAEKCILQMESVAYDRGVELTENIEENITVPGDTQSIEKIVSGLIENALKYEPDGGHVEVSLTKGRKKARFAVRNFGSVIAEEDLPHIFERFFRGDKARSEKGHGLGLPILKGTAELIGAELDVSSSAENGTVFTAVFDAVEG